MQLTAHHQVQQLANHHQVQLSDRQIRLSFGFLCTWSSLNFTGAAGEGQRALDLGSLPLPVRALPPHVPALHLEDVLQEQELAARQDARCGESHEVSC